MAESPQQPSSVPRIAKLTPASWKILARATDIFLHLSSKEPAASHIEQVLGIGVFRHCLDADFLGPIGPQMRAYAPGVGVVFHVPEGELKLWSKVRFHQDLGPSHVDYLGNMLDEYRAVLHAMHAVGAIPNGSHSDHIIDEGLLGSFRYLGLTSSCSCLLSSYKYRCPLFPIGLDILDQFLGRQLFVRVVSRAAILAASAARTGVGIENLLPGELFQVGNSESLGIFKIANGLQLSERFQALHELVGRRL